jgi:hypothetical protein
MLLKFSAPVAQSWREGSAASAGWEGGWAAELGWSTSLTSDGHCARPSSTVLQSVPHAVYRLSTRALPSVEATSFVSMMEENGGLEDAV